MNEFITDLFHKTQHLTTWKFIACFFTTFVLNIQFGSGFTGKALLVGFDGFRYDYMDLTDTPNFHRIKEQGTSVPYINNVFTTITFPSMYSIVTGLHPESHGIVGYTMYDPVWNETWSSWVTDPKWYDEGEPIWVTAKKQGLDTGAYFWLGSQVKIRGILPDFYYPYNESVPFKDRIDEVIRWFTEEEVSVVALYFHEPDNTGHIYGPAPQSSETVQMIKHSDDTIGYLLEQMQLNDLKDKVNLIVTSDHGMAECNLTEKVIRLYEYVPVSWIKTVADEGAVANILPYHDKIDDVYEILKDAHPKMTVYYKEDVPDRLHFKHHRRIHPIVAIADEEWLIFANGSWDDPLKGMHGYDNQIKSMKPFFLAMGPDIKENYTSEIFDQVDIYPFICTLLGIVPSPNNGSVSIMQQMLKEAPYEITSSACPTSTQQSLTMFLIVSFGLPLLYTNSFWFSLNG